MLKSNKQTIGGILLVAGTCIGSGMIALPIVLAQIGIIYSVLLMVIVSLFMYYTSLISLELNLQAGAGKTLGELGALFDNKLTAIIGHGCLKLLSYALLSAFFYGIASITQKIILCVLGLSYGLAPIISLYALFFTLILMCPIKTIDYTNRILFITMVILLLVLIIVFLTHINYQISFLPPLPTTMSLSTWSSVIPIIFTSFGFQVIFHTLTNYYHGNARILQHVFKWGIILPSIIYIMWICTVLILVYQQKPLFYQQMISANIEIGQLVLVLGDIIEGQIIQYIVWIMSMLAIITSILGVGIGLVDSLKNSLSHIMISTNHIIRNLCACLIAIIPPMLVSSYVPNAFIAALSFAGMILVVIAILLPIYLLYQAKIQKFYYKHLKSPPIIIMSVVFGLMIIVCEIHNILKG